MLTDHDTPAPPEKKLAEHPVNCGRGLELCGVWTYINVMFSEDKS